MARLSPLLAAAIVASCAGNVGGTDDPTGGGGPGGSNAGASGNATAGGGTAGAGGNTAGASGGGTGGAAGGIIAIPPSCQPTRIAPGRAPLRRLTRFEFNNTIRDVLSDTTNPGSQLPPEVNASTLDLFGNSADSQPVSSSLAAAYSAVAADVATRATTGANLAKLDACAATITATTAAATQTACARKLIEGFTSRAYRRAVATTEVDELLALHSANATPGFANGIAAVIEAVLQSPDFLYRIEWGVKDPANPAVARPTADEMATRLSYTLWGTVPDATLLAAAKSGALATAEGVRAQATRMLNDPKSHAITTFFFDKVLPISTLTDKTRDITRYPTFNPQIGAYMHQETQRFLEYEVFENPNGSWKTVLTAPYTFVNGPLATYYGLPGVTGTDFVKVPIDTTKRKGVLTQGGVMTGTITTNESNPVLRGSFVVNKLLCRHIDLPADPTILAKVKIPEPDGTSARARFSAHSSSDACKGCHQMLDPLGFALENFDAVGLWRDTDSGETINASGSVPGLSGAGGFQNAVGMIDQLAASEEPYACFASHWLDFAFGRPFDAADDKSDDACLTARIDTAFKASGYNVKQLLIDLTQSDAFLYMPAVKE